MTTISERLREQAADYDEGMFDRLEWEAADTFDALVAALEAVQKGVPDVLRRECLNQVVEDALVLARSRR